MFEFMKDKKDETNKKKKTSPLTKLGILVVFVFLILIIINFVGSSYKGGKKDGGFKLFPHFFNELNHDNETTTVNKESVKQGSSTAKISEDDFVLETVNVGQGLCLIMSCEGETAMYDGGEYSFRMNKKYVDARNKVWDKYNYFKYVFLSHYDSDHAGGLVDIIYKKNIGKFIKPRYRAYTKTYNNIKYALKNRKVKNVKAKAKKSYKLGSAKIKILRAEKKSYDENDNSIVLKVTHGGVSYMITGDLTNYGEYKLTQFKSTSEKLPSTVLVVGHHGSGKSTSNDFLHKVSPYFSIISVGKENQYGHPDDSVLVALRSIKSKIFRTDEKGTITTWDDGKTIHIKGENNE